MPEIVFICTKNQFRSPLAAAMLSKRLVEHGFGEDWVVQSAGSWVRSLAQATPEALVEAAKRGLDLSQHCSFGIEGIQRNSVDLFLVMEEGQKESILLDYPKLRSRLFLLSEMSGVSYSIPDPYVTGDSRAEIATEIEQLIENNFENIIALALKLSHR